MAAENFPYWTALIDPLFTYSNSLRARVSARDPVCTIQWILFTTLHTIIVFYTLHEVCLRSESDRQTNFALGKGSFVTLTPLVFTWNVPNRTYQQKKPFKRSLLINRSVCNLEFLNLKYHRTQFEFFGISKDILKNLKLLPVEIEPTE